ncbi:MAG: glycine cleavage system aminomethyltransferase GcvT [Saprospiraceae bacterium]|jgi:aminomethyltransferase|nr:glycine cleavage system aminomethyltransferase GcvT [Saprospiraceae bacterium]
MKNTPLTDIHIKLGAKMAEFAGYNMPISYAGIKEEHQTVRTAVGVFDVSHMGEFILKGKNAAQLIQYVTTNDVNALEINEAQYSCMPNGNGGIVDDLLVYRLPEDNCAEGEQAFLLVVNASNIEKDWNWISGHNKFDVKMTNISENTGLLAVQGPKAIDALQSLTDINLSEIKYYTFRKGTIAGIPNAIISATGYTGSGGFEIYVDNEHLARLWEAIFEAGKDFGIQPIGLGARDTLRLEMGFCLYGNDIDDTTSPIEAGLGWITKLNKGEFIDCELYKSQKENGVSRKLVGFKLDDRRVPRHGYLITDAEGCEIGVVTSGTQSPSLGYPIGTGYVSTEFSKSGSQIYIDINGKKLGAVVTKLPFYKVS